MAEIFFYLTTAPIGYVIGRIGHVFGGHIKTLHHWIYGIALIIFGVFSTYFHSRTGVPALFFGSGLFLSDFKDFWNLRVYGVDEEGAKYFWGID